MSFIELFNNFANLVELKMPELAYMLRKFSKLTFYERITTLKALVKFLDKYCECRAGVIPYNVTKNMTINELWKLMNETNDPLVTENEMLLGIINLEGNEASSDYCICGGGTCVENPPYPCSETIKDWSGKYVCDKDYRHNYYHRLGICDGRPWWQSYRDKGTPNYRWYIREGLLVLETIITPSASYTVQSIVSIADYNTRTSTTCCSSCPTDAVVYTEDVPIWYWEVEAKVESNASYKVMVGYKLV